MEKEKTLSPSQTGQDDNDDTDLVYFLSAYNPGFLKNALLKLDDAYILRCTSVDNSTLCGCSKLNGFSARIKNPERTPKHYSMRMARYCDIHRQATDHVYKILKIREGYGEADPV